MSSERPTTGGKRPRDFRNLLGPSNFAVVNFLDSNGKKTDEQEVVPVSWVVKTKKGACCHWPKDASITRKQLTTMVKTESPPNKAEFKMYPVRILHSGCTFTEATDKFSDLASKSTAEENDGAHDGDRESDSDESDSLLPPKKAKTSGSKTKPSAKKPADEGSSFSFEDDETSDITPLNNNLSKGSKGNSVKSPDTSMSVKSPARSRSVSKSPDMRSRSVFKSSHRRSLFTEESSGSFLTKAEFETFERKIFTKLNLLVHMFEDCLTYLKSQKVPGQKLISMPASIESRCNLPANDIKTLETLDDTLNTSEIRTELATYLSQLGGKTHTDFLGRVLPKLITDNLCYYTNWSGSAVAPGTEDHEGNVVTREFKKTFSNLTNIIETLCAASRLVCQQTTDKDVECCIKKWLLSHKDRLAPRSHQKSSATGRSPSKNKKTSPKKRR